MTSTGDSHTSYQNGANVHPFPSDSIANISYSGEVKVYKRRWYILLVYCVNAFLQNAMWNTWSPIVATAKAVYDWNDHTIDLIAGWGSLTFCITMIPFAWIMDVKGLRVTMLVCVGLQMVGSVLRFLPMGSSVGSTYLIHCGQIIIGFAGPVGMAAPPLLSSAWFPQHQRTTATALLAVAGYCGTAGSMLIGPAFVDDIRDSKIGKVGDNYPLNTTQRDAYQKQINSLLYFEAAVQLVVLIFVAVYYPALPPKPPSPSAATGRVNFKSGAKSLWKNYNFLLLAVIYGASTGFYGGWNAVLYQSLSNYNNEIRVDAIFAGWLGFVAIISGAISGVVFSSFADHFSGHLKLFLIVFLALAFATTLVISYIFTGVIAFNKVFVYIMFALSGFFANGTIPFFFELGVEITYPVAEGITTGVITFFNNFLQTLFLFVPLANLGTEWMLWATVVTFAISTVLLLLVREIYGRSSVDERISSYTPDSVNSHVES